MTTQASYQAKLNEYIDSATGAKSFIMDTPLEVYSAGDVLKTSIGTDREEWFEVTGVTPATNTISTTARGLSLTATGTLVEVAANRYVHYAGELCAIVTFPNKLHTQNTDTGTTSTSFGINTGGDSAILDTTGLTTDRTYTFPDGDGEIITDDETQPIANKTLTNCVATDLDLDTSIQGTAVVTTLGAAGSDTKLASEKAIRAAITGSVTGVSGFQKTGGPLRTGDMTLAAGDGITVTEGVANTFTVTNNADPAAENAILAQQVFS